MDYQLGIKIKHQPDNTTCGPTSLHAVYKYYKDKISLDQVIENINQFEEGGGTLAVILGIHALKRGYKATTMSFNINIFDPSWFELSESEILEKLKITIEREKSSPKHDYSLKKYVEFLELGGKLIFNDLSTELLKTILNQKIPILIGLSSTWLYRDQRENPITNTYDDILGEPAGHFVVIEGYDEHGNFHICDPYIKNPINASNYYTVESDRLINSILLGISSYDGNLLLIENENE